MKSCILVVLLSFAVGCFGQDRKVVILDMTTRNAETNWSRYLAVEQMLDLIGVPFDSTSQLTTAFDYPIIITGSRIKQDAFSSTEKTALESYVQNGGVLITSNLRDTTFGVICGIDSIISNNEVYTVTWDTMMNPHLFDQVDDSMEVVVSLGRESSGSTFYSRTYTISSGESLGSFENGKSALVHNALGSGHVYTFGPDFRDVIFRPRINQDINAHRVYSNGFEPSSDVFAFIVRNILGQHIPNQVYKYEAPRNYSSVVCLTHDIDSRTAVDTMQAFVDAETSRGISAQYNVTVRYLSDAWMTNFYVGGHQELAYVRDQGHVLASHSVGHFPDFGDESVFYFGELGNTPANYQPVYFLGMTIGGSILGETEVSKNLLEDDFGVSIRSWRSGHLAYPDSLPLALDTLGYEFSSTYSSNDILTNFPYYAIRNSSFSGVPSNVLEIPMTISDVFSSDPITENNYMDKVAIWSDVNRRYDRNNAAIILLIHPNRGWKLIAQEAFLDSLEATQAVVPFEEYGEFWKQRNDLEFITEVVNGGLGLEVRMLNHLGEEQSFVIDTSGLEEVAFFDENGNSLTFNSQNFNGAKKLFYQDITAATDGMENLSAGGLRAFPNPFSGSVRIVASIQKNIEGVEVFDLAGNSVNVTSIVNANEVLIRFGDNVADGLYVVCVDQGGRKYYQKVILRSN
ncbi:T9SS type A sorting domain-containing protein [Parvicella tangerina]|uniref:Secretion system C-terminal sorting domain-containing protein n=1 Tax=Parvicella tangerina TaxID=2829795 RepID=A0A916JQM1_9FLAO|nr:T9SS type A sorting domain-containing protein [Parvicella tangerina]CAG5086484.1 hypothetical protein CRYO30217_03138 [Parvicella tangerina]